MRKEANESKTQQPIYDARALGLPKMLLYGLQHMFAMFGATILVPILVSGYFAAATGEPITAGLTMQTTLFCAGLGTLFFHLCTKLKVPAFLGSSFAYLGGFATVADLNTGEFAGMGANEKVLYACGGIVVAGALYLILALIVRLIGPQRVLKFLPPVVTGPVIICIGLGLAGSAISNASTNWLLAIVALGTIIAFNMWGKNMWQSMPILLGIAVSYILALILNACGVTNPDGSQILSLSTISEAPMFGLPPLRIAKFNITSILVMAPIALASMMEHVGDVSAISATTGKNFVKDPGLHWTLLGDGLATSLAGFFGGPANTTYGENTGVLQITKVYDPRVIRIAAVFAAVLSLFPKFSAAVATMPASIIGGVSIILYGMISAIGVRNMYEGKVDLKKQRNLIIMALIAVFGLGMPSGLTFTIGGTSITLTGLAVASIVGILLNIILPGRPKDEEKTETATV